VNYAFSLECGEHKRRPPLCLRGTRQQERSRVLRTRGRSRFYGDDSLFPRSVTPEVERGSCEVTRKGIPRGGMGISRARGG
jgi:hypothetical protein